MQSPTLVQQTIDCRMALYNFPANTAQCSFVFNAKSSPRLIVVLEKITYSSDKIFPGMAVHTAYPQDSISAKLPSSGYTIQRFENLWPKNQKLYSYWEDAPHRRHEARTIKVFVPNDITGQPCIL